MKYLQIVIPQGDDEKKKEYLFKQLLTNLHNTVKDQQVSLEYLGYEQYTYFFVVVPDRMFETVESLIYSTYPNCEIREVGDYVDAAQGKELSGVRLDLKFGDVYPFKTFDEFVEDSQGRFFSVVSKMHGGEQIWGQIVIKPKAESSSYYFKRKIALAWNKLKKIFSLRDRLRIKGEEDFVGMRAKLAEKKVKMQPFQVTMRLAYLSDNKSESRRKLAAVVNSFYQFNKTDVQAFRPVRVGSGAFLREYKGRRIVAPRLLSAEEIATLYHFPNSDAVSHVVHVLAKKAEAPQDLPRVGEQAVSFFGKTNYHNNFDTFGLKRADRRRHLYTVGKSGSGKSKMLELLIKEDLENGHGVGILDPHGDLVDNVLKLVPQHRIKDVIYFDPADTEFPIAFNPLENVGEEYKMQVTLGFIQIFKKLFGSNWTDRLEHVLRYTVLALLDSPNTTVLSILKMLTDKNYRQNIVSRIQDDVVKNFWVSEFAGWSEKFDAEAITPLLNKVGQFVATNMIRNIIGQPKNKFDIRDIMDGQKILLMKVSKGLLGEENSGLLGAMIITKIYQAAMSRADMPEDQRKDFYLYVDEFQNFATDTFAEILSEARKYRLNLTIAHQYIGQLSDVVRKTVFGNVGSMVNFRVGADDARFLAEEYTPVFQERDIINLGVREFYCKMSVNGEIRQAFSGRTLDMQAPKVDYAAEIVESSRAQFAAPRGQVETLIKKWDEGGDKRAAAGVAEEKVFEAPIV